MWSWNIHSDCDNLDLLWQFSSDSTWKSYWSLLSSRLVLVNVVCYIRSFLGFFPFFSFCRSTLETPVGLCVSWPSRDREGNCQVIWKLLMVEESWKFRVGHCIIRRENLFYKWAKRGNTCNKNTEDVVCIGARVLSEPSVLVHFNSSQTAAYLVYAGVIPSGIWLRVPSDNHHSNNNGKDLFKGSMN